MGYSYGGGVAALRAFAPARAGARRRSWSIPIARWPSRSARSSAVPQPTMVAMGALDDWTPVAQCEALFDRIAVGRDLLETHVYPGAHHSFDALGLPVRYLDGVGNRSKPGGCCGAHYGANEAAWKAFVADVKAFLAQAPATLAIHNLWIVVGCESSFRTLDRESPRDFWAKFESQCPE